jgi:rhomboid protease GluP
MSAVDGSNIAAEEPTEAPERPDRRTPEERPLATILLGLSWVVLYLAMALCQGSLHARGRAALSGGVEPRVAHEFGTMSPGEIREGEPWRALTASFLHFSLFHLGFNLLMFYQLGREVEAWYGPWIFVAVVVAIGTLGNLLSAWLKPLWGLPMLAPSAGGSGVVCGLIALVATVGWRSRTRTGAYIRAQMVGLLVFVAVLGWLIPGVDNLVHGSGAVVGAAIGLIHRRLWPLRGRPAARALGISALLVATACALAQARIGVLEAKAEALLTSSQRRRQAVQSLVGLDAIHMRLYVLGNNRSPVATIDPRQYLALRRQLADQFGRLKDAAPELAKGHAEADFRAFASLVEAAERRLPSPVERKRFLERGRSLLNRVQRAQLEDEGEFERWRAWLKVPNSSPIRVQLGPSDLGSVAPGPVKAGGR